MTIRVYQYPQCSTCRKAMSWLKANAIEFEAINLVEEPPNVETLKRVLSKSGVSVKKLFNTSGEVYRREGYKARLETMGEGEALSALAANGKLIKRPLLLGKDFALVGFDADSYADKLGK